MRTRPDSRSREREVAEFMKGVKRRNPDEPEFHQAVEEFATSVMPWYREHSDYVEAAILERLTEPDRIVSFRVSWTADDGAVHHDRAWRVQFCNALGPYKGGLRFHESVTQSVLKFLGFEQTFKNGLTGLPMGGAKGGATFGPKGKSDGEIMRFCQSMMTELQHYIGEDTDIPAGDIGVHDREIGYLFGQYMRLQNRWSGVLTSKGCAFGGSAVRNEATGYGCIYFCEDMLNHHGSGLVDQRIAISGSGTVALNAAAKGIERGAKVVTLSDSNGFIYKKAGVDERELREIIELKQRDEARLAEFAEDSETIEYHANRKPWSVPCDIAMPCATQNELDKKDAQKLIDGGVIAVGEGANMPTTLEATALLQESGVLFAPGKASNAGGVATSGLEMSQNSGRLFWTREEVDEKLHGIMVSIHQNAYETAKEFGAPGNYVLGANIAGFLKVAKAMVAMGFLA